MIKLSRFHSGITLVFAGLGSEPTEIDSASPCGQTPDPTWAEGLSAEKLEEKNSLPPPPSKPSEQLCAPVMV